MNDDYGASGTLMPELFGQERTLFFSSLLVQRRRPERAGRTNNE
jgi:hypothetical protein